MSDIIKKAIAFEKAILENDSSGHDYEHPLRVERIALQLSNYYDCNKRVIRLASLLHDVDDKKLFPNNKSNANLQRFFQNNEVELAEQTIIINIIDFLALEIKDEDIAIEAKIVQDADNLDALGAIGIARLFAFGGWKGLVPISRTNLEAISSEKHYYERLVNLPNLMNTKEAKQEALRRVKFMDDFMKTLMKEATI